MIIKEGLNLTFAHKIIPETNKQKQHDKDMIFTVFKGFAANSNLLIKSNNASPPSKFLIGKALKTNREKFTNEQVKNFLFWQK